MNANRVKQLVGVSAVCLAVLGLSLLFAGAEVTEAVFAVSVAEPLPAILGAALFGFGSLNWIARHHVLGGIYGRSVVVSNQAHFMIGAIILIKHGLKYGASPGYWALAALYAAGAVLFTMLLTGKGLPAKS